MLQYCIGRIFREYLKPLLKEEAASVMDTIQIPRLHLSISNKAMAELIDLREKYEGPESYLQRNNWKKEELPIGE